MSMPAPIVCSRASVFPPQLRVALHASCLIVCARASVFPPQLYVARLEASVYRVVSQPSLLPRRMPGWQPVMQFLSLFPRSGADVSRCETQGVVVEAAPLLIAVMP